MNRWISTLVGAMAMIAGLVACGPDYDHIDVNPVKGQGTLGASISAQRLEVSEGLVITAQVIPWNDDDERMPLAIRVQDPSIVEVAGVVNDRNYAFIGKKAGNTQIEFVADGEVVLRMSATVVPQPEP